MPVTPKMQCRHVFTDGHRCASPCLRHEDFCYYHHTSRRPISNPAARRRRGTTFTLPELEDRASIQLALSEILQRIAANDLDPKRAGHLLYGLQIAAGLLPKLDPKQQIKSVSEITHDEELGTLAPAQEVGADIEPDPEWEAILAKLDEISEREAAAAVEAQAKPIHLDTLPTIQAVAEPDHCVPTSRPLRSSLPLLLPQPLTPLTCTSHLRVLRNRRVRSRPYSRPSTSSSTASDGIGFLAK